MADERDGRTEPEGAGTDAPGADEATAGGRVLAGRYRLLSVLGSGGMGTVWRAEDEMLGRAVAVKELRVAPSASEDERRRLVVRTLREAKATARIQHTAAVTVFDVVEEDERPWIVMELVESHSLAEVIRREGRLGVRRAAEIGFALTEVLGAAHRAGIVHRDVKPSNVLIGEDGRVVLTDFGIASVEGDPSITSTGMLVGAPSYISPERAQGRPPGPPADLWSLGATLYAMVEGHPPYDKGSALSTLTAVMTEPLTPPQHAGALRPVIEGLLHKDPERRLDQQGARRALRRIADQERADEERAARAREREARAAAGAVGAAGAAGAAGAVDALGAAGAVAGAAAAEAGEAAARPDVGGLPGQRSGSGGSSRPSLFRRRRSGGGAANPAAGAGAAGAAGAGAAGAAGAGRDGLAQGAAAAASGVPAQALPAEGVPAGSAPGAGAVGKAGGAAPVGPDGAAARPAAAGTAGQAAPTARPARGTSAGAAAAGVGAAGVGADQGGAAGAGAGSRPAGGNAGVRSGFGQVGLGAAGAASGGSGVPGDAGTRRLLAPPGEEAAGGRRRVLSAVVALVVLALIGTTVGILVSRNSGGSADHASGGAKGAAGAGSSHSAAASGAGAGVSGSGSGAPSSSAPGSGAGSSPASSAASDPSSAGSSGGALPAGFHLYTDRAHGFSIAVPNGYTRTQAKSSDAVAFAGPNQQFLEIDWNTHPSTTALGAWQAEEPSASGGYPDYRRLTLRKVTYKNGWDAADWEWLYNTGDWTKHSRNEDFVVDKNHAYSIWWTAFQKEWNTPQNQKKVSTFLSSFKTLF